MSGVEAGTLQERSADVGGLGWEALTLTALGLVSAVADAEWAAGPAPVLHGWSRLFVPEQRRTGDYRSRRGSHSHEVGAGPEPRGAGAA